MLGAVKYRMRNSIEEACANGVIDLSFYSCFVVDFVSHNCYILNHIGNGIAVSVKATKFCFVRISLISAAQAASDVLGLEEITTSVKVS